MKRPLGLLVLISLGIAQISMAQLPGTMRWVLKLPQAVVSSPAIADDGTIYVGSGEPDVTGGWLSSVSPEGTTNWNLRLPAAVRSSPAIGANGMVYVGCYNGELKIVSPSGAYIAVATGGKILASPAIGPDGTVYVGSVSNFFNTLYAFNPEGGVKWVFKMGGVPFFHSGSEQWSSPAIGPDGTIYVGSLDKNLYAIHPDGTTNWVLPLLSTTNTSPASASSTCASPAIGPDGTIYIGADNGVFYAVNWQGVARWRMPFGVIIESTAALGTDGTIYLGLLGRPDREFCAIAPDGTEKWSFSTGLYSASPAIGSDGTIYAGTVSGQLNAMSPWGSNVWTFQVGNHVFSSPAIGPDGTIYFGAGTNLYAVYGTNTLMNSSWPMFRGNAKNTARSIQRGLTKPTFLPDGSITMGVTVETGRIYSVETSTNLIDWSELTNFVSTTFTNQVTDLTATNSARRFYRLGTGSP